MNGVDIQLLIFKPLPGSKIKDVHCAADKLARDLKCDVEYNFNGTTYRIPNPESF